MVVSTVTTLTVYCIFGGRINLQRKSEISDYHTIIIYTNNMRFTSSVHHFLKISIMIRMNTNDHILIIFIQCKRLYKFHLRINLHFKSKEIYKNFLSRIILFIKSCTPVPTFNRYKSILNTI